MNAINKDCARIAASLSPYYDGELDGPQVPEVEQHLALCPVCQAKLDAFGQISRHLEPGRQARAPDVMWGRINDALRLPGKVTVGLTWRQKLAIAAAGFLVYFGPVYGIGLFTDEPGTDDQAVVHTHLFDGATDPKFEHVRVHLARSADFMAGIGIPGRLPSGIEFAAEAQFVRHVAKAENR